ncbi:hypothetical protein RhiJN_10222 [Ceratobasidium sp. AG-Ba]|nr:hypothetical protein RhiJN_10222 [Ceratobasidium sp. AG-Ba]QRW10976.1 hypothetical protein RhiLY_09975 [Ceratobasidium sp. AG-Ba]
MSQNSVVDDPVKSTSPTEISLALETPALPVADEGAAPLDVHNNILSDSGDTPKVNETQRGPLIKHQDSLPDAMPSLRPKLGHQRRRSSRYSQMTMDYFGKIPASYNALASLFTWILLAGFVVGPSAQQAAQKAGAGEIYEKVVTKVPMPGFLNGLAGTLAAAVNIWAIQGGEFHFNPPAIITISVTGGSTVICLGLTIVYQVLVISVKRQHQQEMGDEAYLETPDLLTTVTEFDHSEAKKSIFASLSLFGNN